MMQKKPIGVFIVDDSAVVRMTIGAVLENEREIRIVGTAGDPLIAMGKFARDGWPDVIILDIEMPRMDGLSFLKKIMQERPTPVIICSIVAQNGSRNAMEALSLGAVEVIPKPQVGLKDFLNDSKEWLLHAIRAAALSGERMGAKAAQAVVLRGTGQGSDPALKKETAHAPVRKVVVIGASTGGVQVLEKILAALPQKCPPILIVQHMPPGFTKALADRLDRLCQINVKEAESGDRLIRGRALLAPGDRHMTLKRSGDSYVVEVKDGPRVNRHKPSVDVLFNACAEQVGTDAIGFVLTGMGDDGARGLKAMRERGALTYTQEESGCTVYGMPKAAMEMGASMGAVSLVEIIETITRG